MNSLSGRARTAAALGGLSLLLIPSGNVAADSAIVEDPSGDSNAPNDAIYVGIENTGPRVLARVTYRDLGKGHLGSTVHIDPGNAGGTTFRFMRYKDSEDQWKLLLLRSSDDEWDPVKCPGKKSETDPDEYEWVIVSFPRDCLGNFKSAKKAHFQVVGRTDEDGDVEREYAPEEPMLVRKN